MLDIQEGDFLVVGDKDYPIRSASTWSYRPASRLSFLRIARLTAKTKRSPLVVGGRRGAAVELIHKMRITPLDPVSPELRARLLLDTPNTLFIAFVPDDTYYHQLIVEELVR